MWLRNFKFAYLQAVLDLLWRQWATLGVIGRDEGPDTWILDPEAMVIATIHFGRYDPRLLDGAIQWWMKNGKWLSSTRLQRLQKGLDRIDQQILSAVVELVLNEQKSTKWESFVQPVDHAQSSVSYESLFLSADGKAMPAPGPHDPIFRAYGFLRPRLEKRNVVVGISPDKPGALRIRFRAFFGVTSRAEIALYLLTHESAHPHLVARRVHYAQPSIFAVLREMAASGLVNETRLEREVEYDIDRPAWQRFFDVSGSPKWADWPLVFWALREIWNCIASVQNRPVTASILGSEFAECARRLKNALHESEAGFMFTEPRVGEPANYVDTFAEQSRRLFKRLGTVLKFNQSIPKDSQVLV